MSETETNGKDQKPKLYWMAIASPVVVVVGWCVLIIAGIFGRVFYAFLASAASLIIGVLLGLGAERDIRQSQGKLKGRVFSISGIGLVIVSLLSLCIPSRGPLPLHGSKWSEGRAIAGTIATAIRAYTGQKEPDGELLADNDFNALGFRAGDLDGTYFNQSTDKMFSFTINSLNPLIFTITVENKGLEPNMVTLDQDGLWTEKND